MSLRKKILLIVVVTFTCAVALLYGITRSTVLSSFDRLEEAHVMTDVNRFHAVIERNLSNLEATAADWALWDDTRDFVIGENSSYIRKNATDGVFVNLKIDFMVWADSSGRLVYSKGYDRFRKQNRPLSKAAAPGSAGAHRPVPASEPQRQQNRDHPPSGRYGLDIRLAGRQQRGG